MNRITNDLVEQRHSNSSTNSLVVPTAKKSGKFLCARVESIDEFYIYLIGIIYKTHTRIVARRIVTSPGR